MHRTSGASGTSDVYLIQKELAFARQTTSFSSRDDRCCVGGRRGGGEAQEDGQGAWLTQILGYTWIHDNFVSAVDNCAWSRADTTQKLELVRANTKSKLLQSEVCAGGEETVGHRETARPSSVVHSSSNDRRVGGCALVDLSTIQIFTPPAFLYMTLWRVHYCAYNRVLLALYRLHIALCLVFGVPEATVPQSARVKVLVAPQYMFITCFNMYLILRMRVLTHMG
ncbi:hypothetical protein BC629DRAFT_1724300 [Irpex lacteus]|nr:hypothetical protein BC629DRAFT_1724300 [Irpex lacteus]